MSWRGWEATIDKNFHHDTNVVNVTLEFKYAPPVDDRKKRPGYPPL